MAEQRLIAEAEQEAGTHYQKPRGRHGEYRPDGTDLWWAKFAHYYQRQLADPENRGKSIVQVVADALDGASPHTVQRWSTEARRRGLLPPTTRTRKDNR